MLYLSRKIGESIVVNNNIIVTVTEIKGNMAKLGFSFPSEVSILRKEIYDRISAENASAMNSDFDMMLGD